MSNYNIIYSKSFERDFNKLSSKLAQEVADEILKLEKNPFAGPNIKKIKTSSKKDFRLKIGQYRVIYRVVSNNIHLLKVIHRKNFEKILKEII